MTFINVPKNQKNYRTDIDGLRAVAVLSVILFHINKSLLPGGFIGVDIFFVISGYLISLHIFRDIELGRFSIIEFYRRRVKRIAPAMLVVIAITLLITQVLLRPEDAEKTAESGLWSLFSLANVYFWLYQDTSYFATASNQLPLLHLWSLGVEEQFYICWPLILMLVYRAKNSTIFIIIAALIATSSFILGQFLFADSPSFVYYMLPTRAGELLVGAIAAQLILRYGMQSIPPVIVTLAAVIGLTAIIASLILLSEDQVFPGLRAITPTVGTAVLILAGHYGTSWPSRLLMLQPMVKIGLISYSAYLWHWPILAIIRYGQIDINFLSGSAILTATFLLAWISYRYIECPARQSHNSAIKIFIKQYIIPAGILAVIAVIAMKIDGYGLRWISDDYKSRQAVLRKQTRPAYEYDYVCQSQIIRPENVHNKHCIVGADSNDSPKAILWGDSNAAHFIGMLGVFANKEGYRFQNIEIGSCPPINADPVKFVTAKRLFDCRNSRQTVWQTVNKFKVIIISSSWTSYQARNKSFLDIFFQTTKELSEQGKLVILLGKVPVIPNYDRLCNEKALSFPFIRCDTPSVPLSKDVANINSKLRDFALKTKNVEYYDVTKYLCPNNACSVYDKHRKTMYYDTQHLSLAASWELGHDILKLSGTPFPFTLVRNW